MARMGQRLTSGRAKAAITKTLKSRARSKRVTPSRLLRARLLYNHRNYFLEVSHGNGTHQRQLA